MSSESLLLYCYRRSSVVCVMVTTATNAEMAKPLVRLVNRLAAE